MCASLSLRTLALPKSFEILSKLKGTFAFLLTPLARVSYGYVAKRRTQRRRRAELPRKGEKAGVGP